MDTPKTKIKVAGQDSIWEKVQKSRHPDRPHCLDLLKTLCNNIIELHGDRNHFDDSALVCGLATLKENANSPMRKLVFIGQQKGRKTQDKIKRNFGMAHPEGYKKAIRFFKLAEKFNLPILSFIDTPGAYPGIEAEKRGQSYNIALSTMSMLECSSPIVSIVAGEGGSGGALAIGVPDKLIMFSNSTYSVISPESCASILWKDAAHSKKAAQALKLSAQNSHRFKICDHIIKEPEEGLQLSNLEVISPSLLQQIHTFYEELSSISNEKRIENRLTKYRKIGTEFIRSQS